MLERRQAPRINSIYLYDKTGPQQDTRYKTPPNKAKANNSNSQRRQGSTVSTFTTIQDLSKTPDTIHPPQIKQRPTIATAPKAPRINSIYLYDKTGPQQDTRYNTSPADKAKAYNRISAKGAKYQQHLPLRQNRTSARHHRQYTPPNKAKANNSNSAKGAKDQQYLPLRQYRTSARHQIQYTPPTKQRPTIVSAPKAPSINSIYLYDNTGPQQDTRYNTPPKQSKGLQ